MKKITAGSGLSGSGIGQAPRMGVVGPMAKAQGTVNPQDIARTVTNSKMPVPMNVGIKQTGRTGGMGRKFAGVTGPTKAMGTT